MKRTLFITAFLFLILHSYSQELQDKLPRDILVKTGILPNGIRYYVRHNAKPEKRAELRLAVNAGSTSEDEDQQGLAHLVEHMAFNGSASFKKNELVDYLESVGTKFGPHLNAYTSFDETVYMLQIPTDNPEILNKGILILHDWANGISFDSLEIEKERGVVVEEWRIGQGANERMRRQYWPKLFKDSRYAVRLPIGKKEVIEKSSQATIKRFYKDWYRPDLLAVIAVGDFDVAAMEEKIKAEFSSIPGTKNPRPLTVYKVPDNEDIIVATATDKEARFADVDIIYKQPKEQEITVADYRRSIAQRLFSAMMNARTNELTRQADPPFLNASSGYGRFVRNLYAYTSSSICKEDGIERALYTLAAENERVRRYGFTESELERQKKEMLRSMEMAYKERDKTESRNLAREYVSNFLNEEPIPGITYEYLIMRKHMDGITLKEVNEFAQQWITDKKNCIVLITAPDKESTVMPSEESVRNIMNSMRAMAMQPYDDKVLDEPLIDKLPAGSKVDSTNKIDEFNITSWTLSNGIRVFSKPTDFKNDEILFTSYSWGGWSLYPESDFLSAASADRIIDESGIGNFDLTALEKKLSGKLLSCSPWIGELQQGLNGSCSPVDLETLFQLIYLYHAAPRKDSVAFTSWIEKQKGVLKNRNADPQSVFSDTIAYIMSGYNYRYRPRTVERLNEIKLNRAFDIYKERFGKSDGANFFFVGNFNIDSLKKLSEKYLGALPAGKPTAWKDLGIRPPAGKVSKTVNMGQEPKSIVMLRWHQPFEYNRHNRNEVNALNKLVSIRLREVLREEKSGVYGVSFNSSPQHFPYEKLEHTVYFSCSPENVEMLIEAVHDVLKEVRERGCEEKNLVKIRETAIREREIYLKENSFWLNVISTSHQNGESVLELLQFNDWMKGVKAADFTGFAAKYLKDDNYARFVLMPAENK